jgi:hypothetical protein
MINKERIQGTTVLSTVGNNVRPVTTRLASEPKNLVTQYVRTELRKTSFTIRVTELWNNMPAEHKNVSRNKKFRRLRKQEKYRTNLENGGWQIET